RAHQREARVRGRRLRRGREQGAGQARAGCLRAGHRVPRRRRQRRGAEEPRVGDPVQLSHSRGRGPARGPAALPVHPLRRVAAPSLSAKRPFAVVTDSTADLPDEWRTRYGIEVVPLKVLFGSETFRDRADMTDAEFFERLAASSKLPTTSAPSPGEFAEVYRRLARDYEACISIHIGAQLSATGEAARVGASSVDGFPVNVIDSETVSMPIAFLCRIAAESATLAEATEAVKARVPRSRVLALLDTLRFIEMGGRVSRA